jgi:glycosyltransferase involved in cell wall biosynthesis
VKVLHLAAGNLFGGIETYLLTLARLRHLCPEMVPHFGVCFPGRLRDELLAAGVPVHDLGEVRLSRPWTVLRGRRRLKKAITDRRIEVAVTHGSWPHAVFAPAIQSAGARLVNAVHDSLAREHWVNRWASRTAPEAVIANSRFTAATVGCVFPGVEVEVCYLPVAPPDVENPELIRRQVRAELNTPADVVVLLQASRLESWKGHRVLLDALAKLKDLPGWLLWVAGGAQKAGEDELLQELKAAGASGGIADRVRYLGQRSDVPRLMAAADIYCQPNTGPEPFGIALVEALYACLPIVTSDLGGAREIVTEECGILCRPDDSDSLSAVLRDLIGNRDSRRILGDAGPTRASELCGPSRQLAALADAVHAPSGAHS